jgi:hypothetical protein
LKLSLRSLRRKNQRGAAMAEGAVVLPLLCIFFGLMMYVHNSYKLKMQLQADSRFAAFSSAAHACADGEGIDAGDQRGVDAKIPAEGNAPDADKDAAVEPGWLETTANRTGTAEALRRTRKVTALSNVYCNPKTIGTGEGLGKLLSFVKHAFGFVPKWAAGLIR